MDHIICFVILSNCQWFYYKLFPEIKKLFFKSGMPNILPFINYGSEPALGVGRADVDVSLLIYCPILIKCHIIAVVSDNQYLSAFWSPFRTPSCK